MLVCSVFFSNAPAARAGPTTWLIAFSMIALAFCGVAADRATRSARQSRSALRNPVATSPRLAGGDGLDADAGLLGWSFGPARHELEERPPR